MRPWLHWPGLQPQALPVSLCSVCVRVCCARARADVKHLEGTGLSFPNARVGNRDDRDGAPYLAGLSQEPVDLFAKEIDR